MPASLALTDLPDFVLATLENLKRDAWEDITAGKLQKYHFAKTLGGNKKKPERGGTQLSWRLKYRNQGNAEDTGLFHAAELNRKNVMLEGVQPWSMQRSHVIWDLNEEAFQSGPERIFQLMKTLEHDLAFDFIEHMEAKMWTAPSSSTLNPMPPAGIPFWLQKYASATPGFGGGDPLGWSSGAGSIATGTYAGWKNWGGQYVNPTRDDLIDKVLTAMDFTYFDPPVSFQRLGPQEQNLGFFTVHSVKKTLEKHAESNNDNLRRELGWGATGDVVIRSVPVQWVPALDNSQSNAYDSSNPFYGVNWSHLYYFFKSGKNMVKMPPRLNATSPTVYERWMFNAGNFCCDNRREGGFVFYVA